MHLQLSTALSLLAFAVSVVSLTISLLSYLRDRSKLRVWSKTIWQDNGSEPAIPSMHIYIANIGRRPVMVLNLVKRAGRTWWSHTIQEPEFCADTTNIIEKIDEMREKSLAHLIAVKMAEGEILELQYQASEFYRFIAAHEDPPVEADYLQVEDVSGALYFVKDSRKNLEILLSYGSSSA